MNACLILIDLQNDYFAGGNMELVHIKKAAANAQQLLEKFRNKKLQIRALYSTLSVTILDSTALSTILKRSGEPAKKY
ncbi:MAG: isochorismatase family protein [Desulfobacterales bacterium]|jgi:nicotinamidase-related amidase|nr:isochorismatase family protein [Desulfobacterales bacterium]